MASGKNKDTYANLAALQVTESAPDALTFARFEFPFSIMDKAAILIHRVEYVCSNITSLGADGDSFTLAMTVGDGITNIADFRNPLLLDYERWELRILGVAASFALTNAPVQKDFSNMPGGGILVAPNPLYLAIDSEGLGVAASGWVRLWYTTLQLAVEDYWQLVESRRIIT